MTDSPGFLWSVAFFLLLIGPLIFIHEMGHYLVGRWCGVKADVFSIGFGRELVGWTDRRGTRWKLSALPLGGYVKFAGDMNPASTPSAEWLALPAAERNRTFQAKKVWQRFLIVLAGPATNFVFAFGLYLFVFALSGAPQAPATVGAVVPGSAAARADIRVGDRVTMIARRGIARFDDIPSVVMIRPGETVRLDLYRHGEQIHKIVTIDSQMVKDRFGNAAEVGMLGIRSNPETFTRLPALDLPGAALGQVAGDIDRTASVLGQVLTGRRAVTDMHGPVGVAKVAGEFATLGWFAFVQLVAMISINLGFINLLPIPLLDGGHLLFYLVEGIKRRPVGARVQEWAFRGGLALLVSFMLFVTAHDIASLSVWQNIAGLIARG